MRPINTTRRSFLKAFSLGTAALCMSGCRQALYQPDKPVDPKKKEKPNFVIIFTDDQGYGDLGCFGSDSIKTPRLDRMAKEGVRFTSFYAQTVCGPSRGALMTARYPVRIGGGWTTNGDEITVAEVLKEAGYATGCIGKWDMSQRRYQEGLVPNDQGFDYYFGTLGANDGGKVTFHRNRQQLNTTTDMASLTNLYTDEAIRFIKEKKDETFLLYLAHTMAHVKIDASGQFKGKSAGQLYGDVIEEIDFSTGRILDTVKDLGLDDNTFILFFSDNGPWSGKEDFYRNTHGGQLATGTAKPLRSGKGSAYEGGFREPCIMRAPGKIPPGRVSDEIISTLDIMPTLAALAGTQPPDDRIIDGVDQTALITERSKKSQRTTFYYHIRG
ncbi:MAG: sulfatase-like hydrolase/transferase, partial [Planctomycetes bacterium]|nr:sulfatase-like hydrolase/transferase [Planctomycetota bacterium]